VDVFSIWVGTVIEQGHGRFDRVLLCSGRNPALSAPFTSAPDAMLDSTRRTSFSKAA
jgi:hypothetical protein